MLKKLKIRLILHNMLMLAFVFTILFAAFSVFVYVREETKITNTLKENINEAKDNFSNSDENISHTTSQLYNVSFTVLVNENGDIINSTKTNLDDESIKSAIKFALESEAERGNYKDLKISFLRKSSAEVKTSAFQLCFFAASISSCRSSTYNAGTP